VTLPVAGTFWPATQPVSIAATVPVSGPLTDTQLRATALPVSGTFWQATQPVSMAASVAVTGPLTDTQLRATALPVSIGSMPSTPVTGTFWQATQPVSIAASVAVTGPLTDTQLRATALPVSIGSMPSTPVTGTFWQATQPVSGPLTDAQIRATALPVSGTFWQATQPVSGPLTDTQLRATAVPVSGTFFQATQPVSGTFWQATQPVSAPTLTKGTQGAGFSVQDLKDSGRTTLALTIEVAGAATSEALATVTESRNGAATATFTSKLITSGKRIRFTNVTLEVETLGSGTAPQRVYLRLRVNTAGATTASSPQQAVWCAINNAAIVKSGAIANYDIPDGLEFAGDGTATYGFTLQFPDWVSSTATAAAKITVIGFEY
jgi:hypothetical protein